MLPQIKPHRWSCLATSFAMVLDIPVPKLFELMGHDGGEVVFPELREPLCRRGIHVQEVITALWDLGFSATPFELYPRSQTTPGGPILAIQFEPGPDGNKRRFISQIQLGMGVLECVTSTGNGHAIAFDSSQLVDPDHGDSFLWSEDALDLRGLTPFRLWQVARRA